jgi:hypothetical protein
LQLFSRGRFEPIEHPIVLSVRAVAEGFEPPDGFSRLSLSRRVH